MSEIRGHVSDKPCSCHECITAGCTRPPVTLAASKVYPQRELHGRELVRWYEREDARKAILRGIGEKLLKHGIRNQRGDEPR